MKRKTLTKALSVVLTSFMIFGSMNVTALATESADTPVAEEGVDVEQTEEIDDELSDDESDELLSDEIGDDETEDEQDDALEDLETDEEIAELDEIEAISEEVEIEEVYLASSSEDLIIEGTVLKGLSEAGKAKEDLELVIPSNVVTIASDAFYNSKNIKSVTFEDGSHLITIGSYAFFQSNISSITLPDSLTTIEGHAFQKTNLTEITIPKNVTSLQANCFSNCGSLTKIDIKSIKEIGTWGSEYPPFSGNTIEEITLAEGIKTIPQYLFDSMNFYDLDIVIPSSVTTIKGSAFKDCSGNGSIFIPKSVTNIESNAFKVASGSTIKFYVTNGSYASDWLKQNGLGDRIYETYSITYQLNGGTNAADNPQTFEKGESKEIKDPSRTGYIFDGWYSNARFTGEKVTSTDGYTASITLYAKWTPISYTIEYNQNLPAGTDYKSEINLPSATVKYDAVYKVPANKSTIYKYVFAGWNTASDGSGTAYKANAQAKNIIATDGETITLYAQWTPTTYNVKYDSNATSVGGRATGTVATSKLTFANSDNATKANSFVIPGYKFKGWNTRADGHGIAIGTGEEENGAEKIGTRLEAAYAKDANATVTLYAQWELDTYSLTLNYNYDGAPSPKEIEADVTTVLSANGVTRNGYTLKNWNTKPDGKGKSYTLTSKGITQDLTLYAQWNGPTTYKVTYVLDGGTNYSKNPKTYNVSSAETARTLYQPTKKGYTFVKWVDAAEADPASADAITVLPTDGIKDISLKAVWEENEYKIVFHGNTEKYTEVDEHEDSYAYTEIIDLFSASESFTLTSAAEEENVGIVAWTTKPVGGTAYTIGKDYSKLSADDFDGEGKGEIHLYAKWGAATYKISYVSEGTIKNTNPKLYAYNAKRTVAIKNPTRDGYVFTGWTETSETEAYDSAKKQIKAGAKGNIELTAGWTPINYTVKLNVNSSDPRVKNVVKPGAELQYANVPYDTGNEIDTKDIFDMENSDLNDAYTFKGWNTSSNGKGKWLPLSGTTISTEELSTRNKGTVTIYAIWEAKTFNINYVNVDPEDGEREILGVTSRNPLTYTYSPSKVVNFSNPTKYGFVFKGWYSDSELKTPVKSIPKNTTGDITVYGKWVVK